MAARMYVTTTALHWCSRLLVLGSLCTACWTDPPVEDFSTESTGEASTTLMDGSSSTSSTPGATSSTDPSSTTTVDPDDGSTSSTNETDTTTDDSGTTTESPPPSCNDGASAEELAFGAPIPLPGVNTASPDGVAWLSPDALEIWISAGRPEGPGGWDVYRATREAPAAAFGAATLVEPVSTAAHEEGISLTADALTLYSASDAAGSMGSLDIMATTRPSTLAAFGVLAPVANVNTDAPEAHPQISADGSELYFTSPRNGTWDIYRAQLGAGGSFEAPTVIGELSTSDNELGPVPSADGLTIYFMSNHDDPDFDIHVATRSTREDGFGSPVNLADVNSNEADMPVWVSSDGCTLVLASMRPGEGGYDLYVAEREL
jgi:WD40-like Beta Propeller Repeat